MGTVDTNAYFDSFTSFIATYSIALIVVSLLMIVSMWRVYSKAGKPGWHSLIPILNMFDMFEIAGKNGWLFLLLIIPIVNIFVIIRLYIGIANKFGKGTGYGIGLLLLPILFFPALAFGGSKYEIK